MVTEWGTEQTLVALGYVSIIISLIALVLHLEKRTRLLEQVEQVKARLLQPPPKPVFEVVVQANDGTQFSFSTTIPLAVGDFVEAQGDGTLYPANLLSSNRIVGVVVSATAEIDRGAA